MTKEEIFNQYAIEQGYESWGELIKDEDSVIGNLVHIDNVTDLIQEELKKKIVSLNSFKKGSLIKPKENEIVYTEHLDEHSILNTEIL